MMRITKAGDALLMLLLGLGLPDAAVAAGEWRFSLAAHKDDVSRVFPVSATPFDPTSLPQNLFFGREAYSSRAVAIELILNAVKVRRNDSLTYRRSPLGGYRISTHWRFRVSANRAVLRYEIRF